MQNRKKHSGREAFTLVEVMLVLLILMTLATVGMLAVRNMGAQAKVREARISIGELSSALENYYSLYDRFPTTQESLDALRNCPASIDISEYTPIIKTDVKLDPWGMPYNYQYPGSRGGDEFDLWSNGPDMESGTADDISAK